MITILKISEGKRTARVNHNVEPNALRKSFVVECRTDGYWVQSLYSKNKKSAVKKAHRFVGH